MRCLVTGGSGFIGSHLVDALLERGHFVRVLDNFSTGKEKNLARAINFAGSRIEVVRGDLRNFEDVRKASDSIDWVFHQGALPSVERSIVDPVGCNLVNAQGTLNILVAARDAGVKKFIFASSSSIYGNSPELPKREDMRPSPVSPYGASKLAAEEYCKLFWSLYGLKTVILRYFNVFGRRQDPGSPYSAVIPKFIKAIADGTAPVIYGDGEQTRDFSYVENVIEANLLAASADGAQGEVFNIGCGSRTSVNELLAILKEAMGKSFVPIKAPLRKGEVRHSYADISKARDLLSYEPRVGFKDGLLKVLDSYLAEG